MIEEEGAGYPLYLLHKKVSIMRKRLFLFSVLLLNFISYPIHSFAASDNAVGFAIQAVLPDNQINRQASFFDLLMKPNQKKQILVKVINTSEQEHTFTININQAYTNSSGMIDYSDSNIQKDKSLIYDICDIAKYKSKVTVKAKSTVAVPIMLKMPSTKFDGTIMAGIRIIKEDKGKQNQYGYTLGLKLSETNKLIDRKMNLINVSTKRHNSRYRVVAKLQNPTMSAYGHLKYTMVIISKKTKKIVKHIFLDQNMQMAPNSTFELGQEIESQALDSDHYNIKLTVSDALNNKWDFTEDFTMNRGEKGNKLDMPSCQLALLIVSVITVLISLIYALVTYKIKNC